MQHKNLKSFSFLRSPFAVHLSLSLVSSLPNVAIHNSATKRSEAFDGKEQLHSCPIKTQAREQSVKQVRNKKVGPDR